MVGAIAGYADVSRKACHLQQNGEEMMLNDAVNLLATEIFYGAALGFVISASQYLTDGKRTFTHSMITSLFGMSAVAIAWSRVDPTCLR